jgi:diguanylate cyclase (GGDEF)-like protein
MSNRIFQSLTKRFAFSLRIKVLSISIVAFALVGIATAVSFNWIVDRTILTLGGLMAERQILYDRYRGLEALRREVALAETLMRSPTIIDWAADELDRDKYGRGIAELEHFRRTFVDRSYFFVIEGSGNYYFNDHDGTYTGTQYRYTLSPTNGDDSWYYKTLTEGAGCHLNVNHDTVLAVTKVWMNCVVEEDGRVLGLVGTGIDLTHFLRHVVDAGQPGVESMFIDGRGAVQASRDENLINFRSLTRTAEEQISIYQFLDEPADREAFEGLMKDALSGEATTAPRFMSVNGRRTLVGVGYLDELGWYNVTIMDVDKVIDRRVFGPIAALLAFAILAMAGIMTLLFKRNVLDRLKRAEEAVYRIESGDFSRDLGDKGTDEIGLLSGALDRMSGTVQANRDTLEAAVRERTEQLERIAYVDPLSGVLNRRGLIDAFQQGERRTSTDAAFPGLLILDIDKFKLVNDEHGHAAGDQVLAEVARRLVNVTRRNDLCARWGGDEFVVMLKECDLPALMAVGNKILEDVRATPVALEDGTRLGITVSIGAHLVSAQDTLEGATSKADAALYSAKRQGRNRLVIFDPASDAPVTSKIGRVA